MNKLKRCFPNRVLIMVIFLCFSLKLSANQIDSLLLLFTQTQNHAEGIDYCLQLANLSDNSDSMSLYYFDQAIVVAKGADNDSLTISVLLKKYHFLHDNSDFVESTIIAEELKTYINSNLSIDQQIDIYNALAMPLIHFGDYSTSQSYYFKAIKLSKESGLFEKMTTLYIGLGRLYTVQGFYQEAEDLYLELLEDESIELSEHQKAVIYLAIGNIKWPQRKFDAARYNWMKAAGVATLTDHPDKLSTVAHCFHNVSYYFEEFEIMDSAIYYCNNALNIRMLVESDMFIGSSFMRLGELHFKIENYKLAEQNYLEAIPLIESSGSKRRMSYLFQNLARCYEAMGQFEKSTKYYAEFGELYKEWVNEDNIKQIAQLEKEFEFDKERETTSLVIKTEKTKGRLFLIIGSITFLLFGISLFAFLKNRRKKQKIANQNKLLSIGLEEKEILLKEVHHRVKNNLQVMSGLLQLQSNSSDNEELKKVLHQSRNRIYSIAIIHELLYQDKQIKEIDALDYFKQIVDLNTNIQEKAAKLNVLASELVLNMDQAIPLGLIINELTINSYKHGFLETPEPEITIELSKVNEEYILIYKDNGSGFSEGMDITKSKSLGIKLVKMMCKQLDAQLDIKSENGFMAEIRFK